MRSGGRWAEGAAAVEAEAGRLTAEPDEVDDDDDEESAWRRGRAGEEKGGADDIAAPA